MSLEKQTRLLSPGIAYLVSYLIGFFEFRGVAMHVHMECVP